MLGQVSLGLGLGAMVCKCNFLPRNKTNCSVELSCRFRDLTAKIIMHIWITRRIISTEYGLDFLDLTENLVLVQNKDGFVRRLPFSFFSMPMPGHLIISY